MAKRLWKFSHFFYSTPCTFDDDLFTACTNELPLLERARVVRDILVDELSESKNDATFHE